MDREVTIEDICEEVYKKYQDEFDSVGEVMEFTDSLNAAYRKGGNTEVEKMFLPNASDEYKNDFKKLITK